MTPAEESGLAKLISLLVKVGALAVIIFMPTRLALDLQLLGGVWMVQIFPAIVSGLTDRPLNSRGLVAGWAIGILPGTFLSWTPGAWIPASNAGGWFPFMVYNGLIGLAANIIAAVMVSWIMGGQRKPRESAQASVR